MKRFYKDVAIGEEPSNLFRVLLDERPLRTPMKALLEVPSEPLAGLLVEEWDAQVETIDNDAMPITRLVTTVIDLMPERREPALSEIFDYAATDLLCYRTPEPADLAERQQQCWQRWLDWSATALDAPMIATDGIQAVDQPLSSIEAIAEIVRDLDHWRLVGVHAITKLTGSVILALAMKEGVLGATEARDAALLDEIYSRERWGEEEEQTRRHEAVARDLLATERFLAALSPPLPIL